MLFLLKKVGGGSSFENNGEFYALHGEFYETLPYLMLMMEETFNVEGLFLNGENQQFKEPTLAFRKEIDEIRA